MTSLIKADTAILKTDGAGRVKHSPQRRKELLDEFERSGLSGAKFAAPVGVGYSTFAAWAAQRRKTRPPSPLPAQTRPSVQWLEAVVSQAAATATPAGAALKLELGAGAWTEVSRAEQIPLAAALLQALERKLSPC